VSVRILPGVRVYWTVYLSHRVRKVRFSRSGSGRVSEGAVSSYDASVRSSQHKPFESYSLRKDDKESMQNIMMTS